MEKRTRHFCASCGYEGKAASAEEGLVGKGLWLSIEDAEVAQRATESLPLGFGLLIFERSSHGGDGMPYGGHRLFAVVVGSHTIKRGSRDDRTVVIGGEPIMYGFTDCNAEYEFVLPEGSKEFVNGAWVENCVAAYDY